MKDFNEIFTSNFEPLELKGQLFVYGIEDRFKASYDYLKTEYPQINNLRDSIDFVDYLLLDALKPDVEYLITIGFFPLSEMKMDLDHSIKHALIGSYKAAFADLRRALELALTMIYLTSDMSDVKKAKEWVLSKLDTPHFSSSLKKLVANGRYFDFNVQFDWRKELQDFYWRLSDFSHNKGQLKSYHELNKVSAFISSTSLPTICYDTLSLFSDLYIQTIGEIVTMLALYNPVILVGIPIEDKFGLNGPVTGFYSETQSALIHKLMPDKYKGYFKLLSERDVELLSIVDYYRSLPDLTVEEFKVQADEFNEIFHDSKNNKNALHIIE